MPTKRQRQIPAIGPTRPESFVTQRRVRVGVYSPLRPDRTRRSPWDRRGAERNLCRGLARRRGALARRRASSARRRGGGFARRRGELVRRRGALAQRRGEHWGERGMGVCTRRRMAFYFWRCAARHVRRSHGRCAAARRSVDHGTRSASVLRRTYRAMAAWRTWDAGVVVAASSDGDVRTPAPRHQAHHVRRPRRAGGHLVQAEVVEHVAFAHLVGARARKAAARAAA